MSTFAGLVIGVPREIMPGERRVAVIPETVQAFVNGGARVVVQSGAGTGAYYDDDAYRQAGAEVAADAREVFRRADLILKVKEPKFNESLQAHEADLITEGAFLVCFLHPANPLNHDIVRTLAARGITSFSLDSIPAFPRAAHGCADFHEHGCGYKAVITPPTTWPGSYP